VANTMKTTIIDINYETNGKFQAIFENHKRFSISSKNLNLSRSLEPSQSSWIEIGNLASFRRLASNLSFRFNGFNKNV